MLHLWLLCCQFLQCVSVRILKGKNLIIGGSYLFMGSLTGRLLASLGVILVHMTWLEPISCGLGITGHKPWPRQQRPGGWAVSVKRVWAGLVMTQFPGHMLPSSYSERALDKRPRRRFEGLGGHTCIVSTSPLLFSILQGEKRWSQSHKELKLISLKRATRFVQVPKVT